MENTNNILDIEVTYEVVKQNNTINRTVKEFKLLNSEFNRIKELADNAIGEEVDELFLN